MQDTLPENPEVKTIESSDITLENLKAGKFTTKDISKSEAARLWREEYPTLEEGAKEIADATGWRPEHFLRGQKDREGQPKKFKDWKEFAQETKEKLPIVTERLNHMTKEKLEADKEIAELKAQIADMSKLQRMQVGRELKKDRSSVDVEIKEAREMGDVDRFAAAQERKAQIESEERILKEFEQPQSPPKRNTNLTPEVIAFRANNDWFEKDKAMTLYARQLSNDLAGQYPHLTIAQNLQMVEDDIRVTFASKFDKSSNSNPPRVESGQNSGRMTFDRDSEITFDQLPEDERSRAERMIRQRITTKSDFMKGYNADQKSRKQNRS